MATIMPQIAFCALAYLLHSARSVQAQKVVSVQSPRSYAPWKPEEVELLRGLLDHGVSQADIAKLLQRTTNSVEYEINRNRLPEQSPHYPFTSIKLCCADLELLDQVPELARYLEWDFAVSLPVEYSASSELPTLRIIEVEPDLLYREWRLERMQKSVEGHWAVYRNDADIAVQGIWADLAAILTQNYQQVLLRPPDRHHKRRTAVRSMLKRAVSLIPRNSVILSGSQYEQAEVVLLDNAQAWSPRMIREIKTRTVIAVIPFLGETDDEVQVRSASPLPSLVRYEAGTEKAAREAEIRQRQDWLREASDGRIVETYKHTGLSNTARELVPVDWVTLKHMPPQGTLYVPDLLGLTQASVWYALVTGLRPAIHNEVWLPGSPNVSADDWHNTIGRTINSPAERMRQRMLLDLAYRPKATCGLAFAIKGSATAL